jgi:hypothetical protein
MSKIIINKLLNTGAFNNIEGFREFFLKPTLKKRYSIMKSDYPYPIGNNQYRSTFCFFFYSFGYLMETFYCEVTGSDKALSNAKINCYLYPCNDIGRSDDWEWVDVK